MRKLGLIGAALILTMVACTNSQKGTETKDPITQETVNKMKVENVSIQEWISGVEGGTNSIEFKLDISTGSELLQPDSVHFQDYHCAIFLRNEANGTYSGKMNKIKDTELSKGSPLHVSFKGQQVRFEITHEKVSILKPVHMP